MYARIGAVVLIVVVVGCSEEAPEGGGDFGYSVDAGGSPDLRRDSPVTRDAPMDIPRAGDTRHGEDLRRQGDQGASSPVWVFRANFEGPGTFGKPADAHDLLTFKNLARPPANHLQLPPEMYASVYYEDGGPSDRYARFIDDPTRQGNRVLHYWLKNAVIDAHFKGHTKGRIQTQFTPGALSSTLTELFARQRIYLHSDWALARDYPNPQDWWLAVMIQEFWLGPAQTHPSPGRISFYLGFSPAGKLALVVGLHRKEGGKWIPVWQEVSATEVPIGEWFTLDTGYKMGDSKTGRLAVTLLRAGAAASTTVIDRTDWTYNPLATAPVPLSNWNPQKVYASDNFLHYVRDKGGVVQVYFDDLSYSDRWPGSWPP